ncbi:MAG TPA: sulfatase-like hydrolase/transferase [Candidatus Binatia bacterium]|nr:sulfatase-like hydrolase/transferase [Candidatus Binatia bacterium]
MTRLREVGTAARWTRSCSSIQPVDRRGVALALICGLAFASCGHGEVRPPNIFLLLIDTLRADRVSCYQPAGAQPPLTPFLAAFAEHSAVFRKAYAQSSWTKPSVASLFTSRYPSQHHVTEFGVNLAAGEATVAAALKARGYSTASFSANVLVSWQGYEQGFDHFAYIGPPPSEGIGKGRADQVNSAALTWLDEQPTGSGARPVFLYLHYMEPHIPFGPPGSTLDAIMRQRGPLEARSRGVERARKWIDGYFALLREQGAAASDRGPEPIDDEILGGLQDLYEAEVLSLDTRLAEFFSQLQNRGWLDHALVVVTADHGEELRDHGKFGHGGTLYNEVVHVPLLIRPPHAVERTELDDAVALIDVAPTLLDYSGAAPPATFEGRSLRGLIEPRRSYPWLEKLRARFAPGQTRPVYSELFPYYEFQRRNPKRHRRSVIVDSFKLIQRVDGSTETYNLADDAAEQSTATAPSPPAGDLGGVLDRFARRMANSENSASAPTPLDASTTEKLHALGYVH